MNRTRRRNIYPKLAPLRNSAFLFAVPSEGQARFVANAEEDTCIIGNALGSIVAASFQTDCPVNEVCLYGSVGSGKSVLADAVFSAFDEKPDGASLHGMKSRERVDSVPKCLHVDYAHFWNPVLNKVPLPQKPAAGEVCIAEWCEMAPEFEPNRVEIEIGIFRTAEDACLNPNRSAYVKIFARPYDRHRKNRMISRDEGQRWIALKGYGSGIEAVERLKSLDSLLPLAAPAI